MGAYVEYALRLIKHLAETSKSNEMSEGVAASFLVAVCNLNAPAVAGVVRSESVETEWSEYLHKVSTSTRDVRLTVARCLTIATARGFVVSISAANGLEFDVQRVHVGASDADLTLQSSTITYTIPRASVPIHDADVLAIAARDPYPFTGTNRSFSLMETATMATTNFHDFSVFDVPDVHLAAKLDIWTSPDLNLWSDGRFSDEKIRCNTSDVRGAVVCSAPRLGDFVWMRSGLGACASYSRCAARRRAVTGYCVGSRKCCGPECKEQHEDEGDEEQLEQDDTAKSSEDLATFAVEMVLAVHNAALQAQNKSTQASFKIAIAGAFAVELQTVAVAFTSMNRRLLDNMLHQHQLAIAQVVGISASSVRIQISSDQSRHLLDGMNVQ